MSTVIAPPEPITTRPDHAPEGERTAYRLGVGPCWEVRGELDDRELAALAVRIAAGQR